MLLFLDVGEHTVTLILFFCCEALLLTIVILQSKTKQSATFMKKNEEIRPA